MISACYALELPSAGIEFLPLAAMAHFFKLWRPYSGLVTSTMAYKLQCRSPYSKFHRRFPPIKPSERYDPDGCVPSPWGVGIAATRVPQRDHWVHTGQTVNPISANRAGGAGPLRDPTLLNLGQQVGKWGMGLSWWYGGFLLKSMAGAKCKIQFYALTLPPNGGGWRRQEMWSALGAGLLGRFGSTQDIESLMPFATAYP